MPIYKYVSPDTGLKYLASWKLRYSLPGDLNDPFEIALRVRAATLSAQPKAGSPATETTRRAMADVVRGAQDIQDGLARVAMSVAGIAILCFTRAPSNVLMWGHYAASHTGLLLEFNEEHDCFARDAGALALSDICGRLGSVAYTEARPSIAALDAEAIRRVAYTKALDWAYEQEVRLLWPTQLADGHADPSGKVTLFDVPAQALLSVTFGHQCTAQTRAAAQELLELGSALAGRRIRRFQSVPNRDGFWLDKLPCD